MQLLEDLKTEITDFMRANSMNATAFGKDALNDPNFVHKFLAGEREPRFSTISKVREFMASYESEVA